MAREEAQGQLQWECATLEEAWATLKLRDEEVSRLNMELVQLSISYEDQRQAARRRMPPSSSYSRQPRPRVRPLRRRRNRFKVSCLSHPSPAGLIHSGFAPNLICVLVFRPEDGSRELDDPGTGHTGSLQLFPAGAGGAAGRCPQDVLGIEEGEAQDESSMASRLRTLCGHVTQRMHRTLHLGVQKALGMVASHYQVDLKAISTGYVVPVGVDDEVAMNRVDTLPAPAANVLTEDFMDFLFPDAPPTGGPQA
jgi:hypothetical protein